ncbi:MAG: hypothetical protein BWY82_02939 [Verrucomicrobia bacterium ADurb.Bin474]|nr:MAG: hypothetical protein BWY82_02939 [Verrucomicrobia bacterium ADurb.Bin474]
MQDQSSHPRCQRTRPVAVSVARPVFASLVGFGVQLLTGLCFEHRIEHILQQLCHSVLPIA